ncbi:unnamed protein product [Caenorhabditis sp. 36 PRJEB53466]|nr:unnamed protein product [Caenorhabditis sp. 36 PRJEB53466]
MEEPIKSRELKFDANSELEVMAVLPFLCPDALESIELVCSDARLEAKGEADISMLDVVLTPQFKQARAWSTKGFVMGLSPKHFVHIEHLITSFSYLSVQDVQIMQQAYLEMPGFVKASVQCTVFNYEAVAKVLAENPNKLLRMTMSRKGLFVVERQQN